MSEPITIKINGQEITTDDETTILDAAAEIGVDIPVVCYHPHLTGNGLCRVCSVDTGGRVQAAACVSKCYNGMEVTTDSEKVHRGRRTILEMLASTVDLSESPEILALLEQYQADTNRFSDGEKRTAPIYDDNPFFIRDYNQCVNCWRCVQVCADDAQFAFALSFDSRGFHTKIATFQGDGMMDTTCVFCGQCVGVCPTGALKPKRQSMLEDGIDPDTIFLETRGKRKKKKGARGK